MNVLIKTHVITMADVQSVKNLLKGIKTEKKELHCLLSLVFHCGIGKHEMCFAKTGDVTKRKGFFYFKTNAKRKKSVVEITGDAFDILKKHLSDIQISSADPNNSPLFPTYHEGAGERKISHHLKKLPLSINPNQINIHMINTAGIKMYYEDLIKNLSNKDEALKKVGKRFRISTDEVEAQLQGKVKLAGKQKNIYENAETIWDIIEELNKIKAQAKLVEIDKLTIEFHARLEKDGYKDDKKNQLITLWEEKIKNL